MVGENLRIGATYAEKLVFLSLLMAKSSLTHINPAGFLSSYSAVSMTFLQLLHSFNPTAPSEAVFSVDLFHGAEVRNTLRLIVTNGYLLTLISRYASQLVSFVRKGR
jgi:hypothetical protein